MDWRILLDIALGAVLINNFILVQFLGICPFMGVSKKMDTSIGMGLAVIFVMGLAVTNAMGKPLNALGGSENSRRSRMLLNRTIAKRKPMPPVMP